MATKNKKMDRRYFTAEEDYKRVDSFLSDEIGSLTRSAIKKIIDDGNVFINGVGVKAGKSVKKGDGVEIIIPDPEPLGVRPENIPVDIVYEDDDIAVVNKPQGMVVHAGSGNTEGTLVNALLYRLDSLSGINGVIRPGIVHRIDKDTSGLLVVAKNDRAHVALSKQIAEKTCHRIYVALQEGELKEDEGKIITDIARDPSDRIKMAVVPSGKGKNAITYYKVLKRYVGYTFTEFTLYTGRTHQIRVHAKYMGHPIVGDPVYGYKRQKFKLGGQLLHAHKLILTHPASGKIMEFSAPIPDYFSGVLNSLEEKQ